MGQNDKALQLAGAKPIALDSFDDVQRVAKACAASGFFNDSRDAACAIVKIMAGAELGIPPIAAMTGIHVVKGKTQIGSTLLASQLRRHPAYDYRVREMTDERVVVVIERNGEPAGESSFSMDDARAAGLAGGMYDKYRRNMLFARALSNAVRWFAPDLFSTAVYVEGELEDEAPRARVQRRDPVTEDEAPRGPVDDDEPLDADFDEPEPFDERAVVGRWLTGADACETFADLTEHAARLERDLEKCGEGARRAVHAYHRFTLYRLGDMVALSEDERTIVDKLRKSRKAEPVEWYVDDEEGLSPDAILARRWACAWWRSRKLSAVAEVDALVAAGLLDDETSKTARILARAFDSTGDDLDVGDDDLAIVDSVCREAGVEL